LGEGGKGERQKSVKNFPLSQEEEKGKNQLKARLNIAIKTNPLATKKENLRPISGYFSTKKKRGTTEGRKRTKRKGAKAGLGEMGVMIIIMLLGITEETSTRSSMFLPIAEAGKNGLLLICGI